MSDTTPEAALLRLADAAHAFALKWKPRPRISGPYARALAGLVDAARRFAERSDAEWAAEVGALRDELRIAHMALREGHVQDRCPCKLCCWEAS